MIEPTGYTALDLIGFTDRGAYDPTANYVKNDIVTVGNTKWRCKIDDTTGVTPAENANWTIYLESATSLAGMDDVTLTSPKDGDGLVHDGNDWKNVPIVTQAQNDILGSKNVAVGAFHNGTENGITWTVDSENVVTITASAGSVGPANITSDEFILPKGTWILSKNPIQIPNIRIALLVSGSAVAITYDEEIAYYASSDTKCRIRLYVPSTTGALNVKFYPMIRPSIVKDNSYAPPAMTNRQLTEVDAFQEKEISVANGYSNNDNGKLRFQKRNGVVTCLWVGGSPKVPSANTEYNIAAIPSGYVPKFDVCVPCVNLNTFSDGVLFLFKTNGEVHIIGYSTTTNQLINTFPTVSYVTNS